MGSAVARSVLMAPGGGGGSGPYAWSAEAADLAAALSALTGAVEAAMTPSGILAVVAGATARIVRMPAATTLSAALAAAATLAEGSTLTAGDWLAVRRLRSAQRVVTIDWTALPALGQTPFTARAGDVPTGVSSSGLALAANGIVTLDAITTIPGGAHAMFHRYALDTAYTPADGDYCHAGIYSHTTTAGFVSEGLGRAASSWLVGGAFGAPGSPTVATTGGALTLAASNWIGRICLRPQGASADVGAFMGGVLATGATVMRGSTGAAGSFASRTDGQLCFATKGTGASQLVTTSILIWGTMA